MGRKVLNAEGKEVPIVMGSYGDWVEKSWPRQSRLFNDEAGIIFPATIAPLSYRHASECQR